MTEWMMTNMGPAGIGLVLVLAIALCYLIFKRGNYNKIILGLILTTGIGVCAARSGFSLARLSEAPLLGPDSLKVNQIYEVVSSAQAKSDMLVLVLRDQYGELTTYMSKFNPPTPFKVYRNSKTGQVDYCEYPLGYDQVAMTCKSPGAAPKPKRPS